MKRILVFLFSLLIICACNGQEETDNKIVGGPCQDCEAATDYELLALMPASTLSIPGHEKLEPKIKITGTVYQLDGKTPAENIILYIYHTDRSGLYQPGENPQGYESRHGKYRGWMKTAADGKFEFHTFRPAAYPNTREPEHIHLYIKEPGKVPYYVDSYMFEDDPFLTEAKRTALHNRGGYGIVNLQLDNGNYTAQRDIILGLNIPNYK